jgi:nitrate reductase NapE
LAFESRSEFVQGDGATAKRNELKVFLFLTVVLWPVLAVAVVGTYGLIVWVYQMLMGPPTG